MRIDKSELNKYEVKMIIAGSRSFTHMAKFEHVMFKILERFRDTTIAFISGMAPDGADAMIIDFCDRNNLPWVGVPADWDNVDLPGVVLRYTKGGKAYNAVAGHWRNQEMADMASHLVVFWNGKSTGTHDMLKRGHKLELKKMIVNV